MSRRSERPTGLEATAVLAAAHDTVHFLAHAARRAQMSKPAIQKAKSHDGRDRKAKKQGRQAHKARAAQSESFMEQLAEVELTSPTRPARIKVGAAVEWYFRPRG